MPGGRQWEARSGFQEIKSFWNLTTENAESMYFMWNKQLWAKYMYEKWKVSSGNKCSPPGTERSQYARLLLPKRTRSSSNPLSPQSVNSASTEQLLRPAPHMKPFNLHSNFTRQALLLTPFHGLKNWQAQKKEIQDYTAGRESLDSTCVLYPTMIPRTV